MEWINEILIVLLSLLSFIGSMMIYFLKMAFEKISQLENVIVDLKIEVANIRK